MKWVIEILNNRLRQMNDAYEKYVLNGNVNTDSPNAVENRKKAKQLSNAIKILSATVNTSDGQLTIPAVIPSVCVGYIEADYRNEWVEPCHSCHNGSNKQTEV